VVLTVFDREGDILRHTNGTWLPQEQRLVTTFASLRGAYRAVVRLPDHTTRPVRVVERADPEAHVAVLALEAPSATSTPPPRTLEDLARMTYEGTPAQQRYLADKRAREHRWEEALSHWQQVHRLDPVLQPEEAAAFTETVLYASTRAQAEGRAAEAHGWLLDAVAWVPQDGDLRLRLAESFGARGAYSEAMAQYAVALPLLPGQAAVISNAMARTYQTWGQGQLRQGRFGEAARLFRTALDLDSTNGELYLPWARPSGANVPWTPPSPLSRPPAAMRLACGPTSSPISPKPGLFRGDHRRRSSISPPARRVLKSRW